MNAIIIIVPSCIMRRLPRRYYPTVIDRVARCIRRHGRVSPLSRVHARESAVRRERRNVINERFFCSQLSLRLSLLSTRFIVPIQSAIDSRDPSEDSPRIAITGRTGPEDFQLIAKLFRSIVKNCIRALGQ